MKEIEHKYLVKDNSYKEQAFEVHRIKQGYLSKDIHRTVRVRTLDKQGFVTIKGKNEGDTRAEFEYEIPYEDAETLLKTLCLQHIIDKNRYLVRYDGFVWEVDEFFGKNEGLVLAEIELPYSSCEYATPSFIGENVTGNPKYYNSNL